jgi:3-phenylpropionate/trans-cinnamate dioxygenase ferredoxin subunit
LAVGGRADEVPIGTAKAFQVEGKSVAVANVGGQLYAFDDICTHRGCSLAEGMLEGMYITCPCHFSVFQIADGSVVSGPAKEPLQTYPVEVLDGQFSIAVEDKTATVPDASTPTPGQTAETRAAQEPAGQSPAEPAVQAVGHERVMAALSSVPLFADLDSAAIERLEAFAFRKSFSAGEVIVEEDRTGNGLYVVLSGSVEVIKGLGGPRPQSVAVLREGEPFGEMALLGDWKRSASVRAMEDVECLGMDRWAFLAHLKSEPNLAIRMLQMLANRLGETNKRLVE